MKDILLFGIQGSGKGTQAGLVSESFPDMFSYFSSGDLFRALTGANNAIGDYVKERLKKGDLINDSVTNALFQAYFHTVLHDNKYMLLDGFPRSIPQMEEMMKLIKNHDRELLGIQFIVPDEIVKERMLERGRADDTEEGIQHRIDQFYEKTQPTIDRFADNANLIKVDANRTVEEIASEVRNLVG